MCEMHALTSALQGVLRRIPVRHQFEARKITYMACPLFCTQPFPIQMYVCVLFPASWTYAALLDLCGPACCGCMRMCVCRAA